MARSQTYSSKWIITLSVRKIGAGGMFRVKEFVVAKALNLLDAEVYARQMARKQGYEIGFLHDRTEVEANRKSYERNVVVASSPKINYGTSYDERVARRKR